MQLHLSAEKLFYGLGAGRSGRFEETRVSATQTIRLSQNNSVYLSFQSKRVDDYKQSETQFGWHIYF